MIQNNLCEINNKCYFLINKLKNNELKNNELYFKLLFNKYYFSHLLPTLCELGPRDKIRFGATIPKYKHYIDKVKLKAKNNEILEPYKYIYEFMIWTHILNDKLNINASNFSFEIHISNKYNNKPRKHHVDKYNDIKFKSCISGYSTHDKNYLEIETNNSKYPLKKIKYIDNKGSKRKDKINIIRNKRIHFKPINYTNTFKSFDAARKIHKGIAVKKGIRISIICYTISNDTYKIKSRYKNYHKNIILMINFIKNFEN